MAWNQPSKKQEKLPRKNRGGLYGFGALIVVAAVGGLCYWLMSASHKVPRSATAKGNKRSGLIQEAPRHAQTKRSDSASTASLSKPQSPTNDLPPIPEGHDLRTPTPGLKTDAERRADFLRRRELRLKNRPKPVFDNPVDQMFSAALSADPRAEMAPMPSVKITAEQYAEFISKHEIKIDENDSEEIAKIKNEVNEARQSMLDMLKDGGNTADVMARVREEHNAMASLYRQAQGEFDAILMSGDKEMAEEYRVRVNKFLALQGAPELKDAKTERIEQMRQMRAARKERQK